MAAVPARRWTEAAKEASISGGIASLLSAAALGVCGRAESGSAAGPVNGPSQWLWGRPAAHRRAATLRHTLVGYVVHHAMASGWALVHEKCWGARSRGFLGELGIGATTAAAACFVDYRLTPQRLQPGFDAQLSKRSLLLVYASFAVGLALARSRKR
jgi:hypothetical protein